MVFEVVWVYGFISLRVGDDGVLNGFWNEGVFMEVVYFYLYEWSVLGFIFNFYNIFDIFFNYGWYCNWWEVNCFF